MWAKSERPPWLAPLLLFILLTVASLSPIWSNDYFWHLAAGRWISEHRALPDEDPLAVASSKEHWINGEWLFQVAAYGAYRLIGHDGIAVARGLVVAALFTFLYVRSARELSPFSAFCATFFAWYGALPWLRERPATAGTMLFVLLVVLLEKKISVRRGLAIFLIIAVWINTHPSAVLAPAIVFLYGLGEMIEERVPVGRAAALLVGFPAVVSAALLINPYGVNGVINPFRVARAAQLPIFSNEEWAPTSFREFPLFTVALIAWALILATTARRRQWIVTAIVAVLLASLAIRYARNQGLFYAATPLLLMTHVRPIPTRARRILVIPVAITVLAIVVNSPFALGIDRSKFPVASADRVRDLKLSGNILSPYGTGGYLIWSFAPERRVLTDGRNELYREYQERLMDARRSSEGWNRFVRSYQIGLAFVPRASRPLFVRDPRTGARTPMHEWDVYFPDREWALVAIDEAAGVFANRGTNSPAEMRRAELPRSLLHSGM